MAISIYPVTEQFAAEIGEIDLAQPLSAATLAEVRSAFARYAVLIFPAQALSGDQHLEFAAHFGPLEQSIQVALKGEKLRISERFADIANMDADGKVWKADSRLRLFQMGNRYGIPTAPSKHPPPIHRCCTHARFHRLVDIPNMPTCARPSTHCRLRANKNSKA